MKLWVRILLPLLVLAGASRIAFVMVDNRPEPERRVPRQSVIDVEVTAVEPSDYTVWVETRGTVRPRTQSTLIPEVTGRVLEVTRHMRAGEFFEAHDVLLRIDPRDYQTQVTIAESELQQAGSTLAEEQARAAQAERDWKRLGESGEPDALVLRKPQLGSARANVASAEASLRQSRIELERTVIRAPYAGRVLEQNVDIGQYVSPGTPLARVYAVDYAEVRLPLTNRQLEFVTVPEIYRSDSPQERRPGPRVVLTAHIANRVHQWDAVVVRADGAIDTESRQLFVVAQVDDPYGKGPNNRPPLKVGQFVQARIEGHTLTDVFVIPRRALRVGAEVLLVDNDDRLENRTVKVLWSDGEFAIIESGLASDDRLVLTPLGADMSGVKVRVQTGDTSTQTGSEPSTDNDSQSSRQAGSS